MRTYIESNIASFLAVDKAACGQPRVTVLLTAVMACINRRGCLEWQRFIAELRADTGYEILNRVRRPTVGGIFQRGERSWVAARFSTRNFPVTIWSGVHFRHRVTSSIRSNTRCRMHGSEWYFFCTVCGSRPVEVRCNSDAGKIYVSARGNAHPLVKYSCG